MSDPIAPFPTSHNQPTFTVSELSGALKKTVEEQFSYVRVRGEITGFKPAPSGHWYFSLKDENAVLASVCWKGTRTQLACNPEDGLEVICTGRLTTYAGQSKYQLIVEHIELAGVGALMALLEKRKKQLAAEGLFDPARKKPLPFLPQRIGIITSPTGAVIRDILHRIRDRFPVHVMLWPVLVQGDQAAGQIAAAIQGFNALPLEGPVPRPDVLIVARGGGSLEDLWAFNEEIVVRAAAASAIPLISAVGHETDTTLIDFAASVRAPTPTAAAEMAVPVRQELLFTVQAFGQRVSQALVRLTDEKSQYLSALIRGLSSPRMLLSHAMQRYDDTVLRFLQGLPRLIESKSQLLALSCSKLTPPLTQMAHALELCVRFERSLNQLISHKLEAEEQRLNHMVSLLNSYHYHNVLERGFALVRDPEGHVISRVKDVIPGSSISIEWHDGTTHAITTDGIDTSSKEVAPSKKKPKKQDTDQATLF